ncbi:MAG: (2Fe-2S)-binding protein [Tepidanaerobacteraceae bacterium]
MKEDILICRCEEVTKREIEEAIKEGATSIDGVKRITRAGKGLCQGRTCRHLVQRIIAEKLNRSLEEIPYASIRPPVRVIKISQLAGGDTQK